MRVAVDARTVYSPVRRGTGKNLIDLYQRVARLRPDWEFLMLHRQAKVADDPFAAEPNVTQKAVEIKGDRWNAWEQIRLPVAAFTARATVLHAPANTAPRVPLVKMVMTIHDLIPVDMPEHTAGSRAWVANVGGAARVARRILTPSHYTKDRLMGHFGLPADRIVVNHWAPDGTCERVTDPSVIDAARARQGLRPGQPYVFGFGAVDPRKNTQRIVEAWASLGEGIRSKVALLLVGLQEPALTEARALAHRLAPEGGWSLMPFADEEDIPALLSGAAVLCYPSLSEGFGLPVLDAFVCHTPVVTSNSTSLPEVAGDAALLVDPLDAGAIRDAMEQVIMKPGLADTLRERGHARLGAFSWERCARTAADVLAEAA